MSVRVEAANSEFASVAGVAFTDGALTASFWFCLRALPATSSFASLLSFVRPGGDFTGIGVEVNDAGKLGLHDYNADTRTFGTTTLQLNRWYYVHMRKPSAGAASAFAYLGGSATEEVTHTCSTAGTQGFTIRVGAGGYVGSTSHYADAEVRQVKYWAADVAADQARREMYSFGFANTTGAVSWWPLKVFNALTDDHGSADLSATGTLSNGAEDPIKDPAGGCAKVVVVDLPVICTAGQLFSITGLGFTPKAMVVLGAAFPNAHPAAATDVHSHTSVGLVGGGGGSRLLWHGHRDAQTTTVIDLQGSNNNIFGWQDWTQGVRYRWKMESFDADGATFSPLESFVRTPAFRHRLTLLFLGGEALTNVAVGDLLPSNVATTQVSVSGLGFQPDLVLFLGGHHGALWEATRDGPAFGLGWAKSSSSRGCVYGASQTAAADTNSSKTIRTDAIAVAPAYDASGNTFEIDFVSMDSGGFTVVTDTGPGSSSFRLAYLALKGLSSEIGTLGMPTTVGLQTAVSGLAFAPSAVLGVSPFAGTTQTATPVVDSELCIGMAARDPRGIVDQACTWLLDTDALAASDNARTFRPNRFLWNGVRSAADTFDPDGSASVAQFTADGFQLYGDDADGTAHLGLYLAIGPFVADAPPRVREPWDVRFNFRNSAEFNADEVGETYVLPSAYPTTRYVRGRAVVYGTSVSNGGRNNTATLERRVCGSWITADSGADMDFRVDLPQPGEYELFVGCGILDGSFNPTPNTIRIKDNDTTIWEIVAQPGGNGRLHTLLGRTYTYDEWAAQGVLVPLVLRFRTPILKVTVVHQGTAGIINHLRVREVLPRRG